MSVFLLGGGRDVAVCGSLLEAFVGEARERAIADPVIALLLVLEADDDASVERFRGVLEAAGAASAEIRVHAIVEGDGFTDAAIGGAEVPSNRPLDGINLLPILTGQRPETPRTFYWRVNRTGRQQKAIRHGDWKYVLDGGYVNLLFNLKDDIGERRNLAIHHPEIMHDLQQRLAGWEKEMDASERQFIVH